MEKVGILNYLEKNFGKNIQKREANYAKSWGEGSCFHAISFNTVYPTYDDAYLVLQTWLDIFSLRKKLTNKKRKLNGPLKKNLQDLLLNTKKT